MRTTSILIISSLALLAAGCTTDLASSPGETTEYALLEDGAAACYATARAGWQGCTTTYLADVKTCRIGLPPGTPSDPRCIEKFMVKLQACNQGVTDAYNACIDDLEEEAPTAEEQIEAAPITKAPSAL